MTSLKSRASLLMALAGATSWLVPALAKADHTELDRQTDESAYTLRQNQWRLGLFKLDYGIFDQWSVGTYTIPWLLMPITQSPAFDLSTKVKVIDTGRVAVSGQVTGFFFNLNNVKSGDLDDGDFRATVIPMTLATSVLMGDSWTATAQATWVQTFLDADVASTGEASALGAGAQSNLQFALTAEWRLNEHIALNLVTRLAAYVTPVVISTSAEIDDSTSADIDAEVSASDAMGGWLIQPGFTGSWGVFNLRAGLGYGNLFLPGVLLVAPQKMPVPDLDFYFRF